MKKTYITKQGLSELENKILRQRDIIKEIQNEKAIAYEVSGDGWHDNPGFNQLIQKEERAIIDLKMIERKLSEVEVVSIINRNTNFVEIGSILKFRNTNLAKKFTKEIIFEITGSGETNMSENKISYDCPIGLALLGMKKGERKEVLISASKVKLEVLEFYTDWDLV